MRSVLGEEGGMLVHLSALACAVERGTELTDEEARLLEELGEVLGLELVDRRRGPHPTEQARRLAPAAGATLATADAFFCLAEGLAGVAGSPDPARLCAVAPDVRDRPA